MLRLAELWRRAAVVAAWIFQFGGVQRFAALFALIASCPNIAAEWAGALNITVGQEALALGAIRLRCSGFVNIAVFPQCAEHIMRYRGMVRRAGGRIQFPGNSQPPPRLLEVFMVTSGYFRRSLAFLLG